MNQLDYENNIIPRKSTCELDSKDHTLNTFGETIDSDIENLPTKKATLPK